MSKVSISKNKKEKKTFEGIEAYKLHLKNMFNLCLQVKMNALHRKYLGCAQQEYLIGRIKMKRCTFLFC